MTFILRGALALLALAGSTAFAQGLNYQPVAVDRSLHPAAGQPRCANLANNDGFKAYELATLSPMTLAEYRAMYISPPQAYVLGARATPRLLEAHAELVWGRKFRNAQEAVDAFYAACMKSDVARESDQLLRPR